MIWKHSFRVFKTIPALLLILAVFVGPVRAGEDAVSAGTDAASRVRDSWTTEEGFRNITEALTTGNLPLKTLDQSKEGIARINCPGSRALFEILVQPGPTGDLNFISVTYDVDLDGNFDKQYQIPGPVSGICANGFVKCRAGTWQDCHWYAWKFENGELRAEEVVPSDLGGCYCINTGCTQAGFFTFKDQVLRSLGGGVAGAMAAYSPRLSVAESEIDNVVIRYYAQNVGNCSLTEGTFSDYGFDTPEDLYQNAALLATETENEVLSQSADSDSFYSLLTGSPAYTSATSHICAIQYNVSVLTEEKYRGSDCIVPSCESLTVPHGACQSIPVFNYYNVLVDDDYYAETDCNPLCLDGTCVDDATEVEDVPPCGEYIGTKLSSGWDRHKKDGWDDCHHKKYYQYKVNDSHIIYDRFQFTIKDSCAAFENDHDCYLKEEKICDYQGNNCVVTYRNFNPTGVVPVTQCISITGLETYQACVDGNALTIDGTIYATGTNDVWWKIERTYVCSSSVNSVSPDVSRARTVSETLTEGSGEFSYQDSTYGTEQVNISPVKGSDCIPACKLRKVEDRAQATATNTTADYRDDPTSVTFIYRTCINGTCPVNPGETIIKDCQCLNDFNEAIGAMESLRQASIDMICSDGTKK